MQQYIIKRILLFIPTLVIIAGMLFILSRIIPGDAIDALVLEDEDVGGILPPELREQLKAELGLDKPLPVQYGKWLWGALRFDFGTSFWSNRANIDVVKERFGRTIEIAVLGTVLSIFWGVTSGVVSAVKQNTWIDAVVRFITVGGIALPNFFVAVMLFYFLILWFDWIPPIKYHSLFEDPKENLMQVIAPILILGYGGGAGISRLTRSQFLEVFREDYIRTARSKGLKENVVIIRHALRNSILPVITVAGLLVGSLLGGVVIVETVFNIPGMGQLLITSINSRDYPLMQTLVWFITIIFVVSNLLVDIAYAWIDPRIRYG